MAGVDVFISYKRESRALVEQLAGALRDLDINVWFDVALRAGEPWAERLLSVAESAACVLVCWTREAASSPWVLRELEVGLRRGVLVMARLDDHPLPDNLASFHCADLSDWRGDIDHPALQQLVDGVDDFVVAPIGGKFAERVKGQNPVAIDLMRRILIEVAKRRATITYGEALRAIENTYADGRKTTGPTFYATLDAIAAQNRLAREPPLFGLVVNAETSIPGRGYFQKHCFLRSDKVELAKQLHGAHLEQIYAHDWEPSNIDLQIINDRIGKS